MANEAFRFDVATGEQGNVELTAEELADLAAPRAELTAIADTRTATEGTAETLRTRAVEAIETLENAWAGWANLTAAQKDAALKLNVRVTIALARLVLRRLDKA